MEANFTVVESQVLIFVAVFQNMRASHYDLGTPEGTPLDDKTYVWDGEHPKGAGYMLTGFVFALVANLEVLCNSMNPRQRFSNIFFAISKRAAKQFNEWSNEMIETQCCDGPFDIVMQLLKSIHNTIRKMKEIAFPTHLLDIESECDVKNSEVAFANKSIFAIATQLRFLQNKFDDILRLPETDDNAYVERALKELEKNVLLAHAQRNIHSQVLYEMNVKLIKQLTDFRFGLQNSELIAILTGIPETDFNVPETSTGPNRKRPIDSNSLANAQSSLNFDENIENN